MWERIARNVKCPVCFSRQLQKVLIEMEVTSLEPMELTLYLTHGKGGPSRMHTSITIEPLAPALVQLNVKRQ